MIHPSVMAPFELLPQNTPDGTVIPGNLMFSSLGDISPSSLTPEHVGVRDLYNKDCIIYYLYAPMDYSERKRLFEAIYFEWFPHRAREEDLDRGSFFASFFGLKGQKYDSVQLAEFQFGKLCPKLKELQPEILKPEPRWHESDFGMPRQKGLFKIRSSFEKTFLIVDDEAWRDSISVVTRDARTAEVLGGPIEEFESETVGKVMVLRAKLEDAMKAIVAEDDQRSQYNREWSGYYGKWCGGPNEGPPTAYGDYTVGVPVEK